MISHPFPSPTPNPVSRLGTFITHFTEDSLDLDRFVEQGSHLVMEEDLACLRAGLSDLREKIETIERQLPRLARQLRFLADIFDDGATSLLATVVPPLRSEIAFALIYTARDLDLLPDDLPGVGFTDDSAIVEIVLERHTETFLHECRRRGLSWADLQPCLSYRF